MVASEKESIPWDNLDMDKTTKNTAWRWINLKEAELEDKMEVILFKNDPELYHRVKMMEMGKLED